MNHSLTQMTELSAQDLDLLKNAKHTLENPSLLAKITNVIGMPIEKGLEKLPAGARDQIVKVTRTALSGGLRVAIGTMQDKADATSSDWWHKIAVGATGGVGGFFGLAAVAVELPVSTTIMMRSIADIARSEGEDLADVETRLTCLEVFALGGPSDADDASETGYFVTRARLARALSEAAQYIAAKEVASVASDLSAPPLARLISSIASRFSPTVMEKIAATAIPVIGAAAGATINLLFISHFQDIAHAHFTVRRLERHYGLALVRAAWETLS